MAYQRHARSQAAVSTHRTGKPNKQISTYFFGGELKYHTLHAVVDENGGLTRYKSGMKKGKLKMKRVTETVRVPRLYVPSDVGAELTARAEEWGRNSQLGPKYIR